MFEKTSLISGKQSINQCYGSSPKPAIKQDQNKICSEFSPGITYSQKAEKSQIQES